MVVLGDNTGAVVAWSTVVAGMWSTGVGKMRSAGGWLDVRLVGNGPGVLVADDTRCDKRDIAAVEVEALGDQL